MRTDNAQIFGKHLREFRSARSLTQGQLAERCGTSVSAISNFEAGNNSPTLGTLVRLADALECNVSELVAVLDRSPHAETCARLKQLPPSSRQSCEAVRASVHRCTCGSIGRMPENWSREEVEATVAAYVDMLEQELRGAAFNKSEGRRRLREMLSGRSEAAIERKHQNISAILIELGFPYVRGYKPLSNYQTLLYDVIRERLLHSPTVGEAALARAEQPIVVPPQPVVDLLDRLVERPESRELRHGSSQIADRPRPRPLANYLEMEARNRLLGLAGEEFAIRFESERLWRAGQKRLADKIEHVSRTRGDGQGTTFFRSRRVAATG